MKSRLSRVLALSLLVSASRPTWAQPPDVVPPQPAVAPEPPTPNYSESNLAALALIGTFYNKMLRAESYRGRVTTIRTKTEGGKVASIVSSEVQSAWIGDENREGGAKKKVVNLVHIVNVDGKETVSKYNNVVDGRRNYYFYGTKNAWSENDIQQTNPPIALALTRLMWYYVLSYSHDGWELKTERRIIEGEMCVVVKANPTGEYRNEFVFDAKTNDLKSANLRSADEIMEYRWLDSEFNVTLDDSLFEWKLPAGATQVAPETMKMSLEF